MSKFRPGFSHKVVCGFGVVHMQFGLDCIATGIAATLLPCSIDVPILAISSGVFFLLTGAVCLYSAWRKSDASVIASLVLSIISSVLCLVVLIDCGFHIPYVLGRYEIRNFPTPLPPGVEPISRSEMTKRISINALMSVLSLMEGILAIITSGFSCRTLCCHKPEMYAYHQIPMVSLPTGQFSNLLPTAMPVYSDQNTVPLEDTINVPQQNQSSATEVNTQQGTMQVSENTGQPAEQGNERDLMQGVAMVTTENGQNQQKNSLKSNGKSEQD
ncbi:uncharacterized protein [Ptychodera flava]|uniref:uncharacterized protein n=1 Tax=Ptychodera flava TaxID=63121 RepID=UPI00396A8449